MLQHYDCLIVGTGHGGAQAAITLRKRGYPGSIALLGEEYDPPYERPPLSKDYLAGTKPFDRLLIQPEEFWHSKNIALLLGRRVESVDPAAHRLTCADGTSFGYGMLVWAAGGRPRVLVCPGNGLQGVHQVRTRADVDAITREIATAVHVVIVGGGYIGLETAAVLSKLGKRVMVLEAMDRVLARVAGEPLSRFYEAEHRAQGVAIRLGVTVLGIEKKGENGGVGGVSLSTGEVVPADLVIVGIGITPSVEPLIAASAAGGRGVEVDAFCRTSLPDVFAIGDCASHPNHFADGAQIRLESVQNAADQATVVAKFLTGQPEPYRAVPWFWSNQYDLRLQTVGLSGGHDQVVVRGDPARRKFSIVYLKKGRVRALDCVNTVKDFVEGKTLVAERVLASADQLADASRPMLSLVPGRQVPAPARSEPAHNQASI